MENDGNISLLRRLSKFLSKLIKLILKIDEPTKCD